MIANRTNRARFGVGTFTEEQEQTKLHCGVQVHRKRTSVPHDFGEHYRTFGFASVFSPDCIAAGWK
jgi:hypothetical protein